MASLEQELKMAEARLRNQALAVKASEDALVEARKLDMKRLIVTIENRLPRQRVVLAETQEVVFELEQALKSKGLPLGKAK